MTGQSLDGLRALVTGASGGIGGETARLLAARGAFVSVHFNSNRKDANTLVEEIGQSGGQANAVGGDVVSDAAELVAQAAGEPGRIDILVNGAGSLQNLPFGSITEEAFEEQFRTNVLGMIMISQEAAPYFPETGGQIVNISTNLSYDPIPGTAVYSAAKSALITLTHGFARELGAKGITVNAVAPGATDTAMLDWVPEEVRAGIAEATPLGRIGQPRDIAEIIAFLASPASRWINGRTIVADGGLV
ncbi:SDR family NAD(P)-dependent oxidoreductase [Parasphingopyxis algicola]|uniref:SDR family NAD(P)-dependent oxidoreductase n=1 Tax=Parasphingopyxis algicola TaxID=2026624 RepID=UPI001C409565|nr:SDR family oxidoreductase [Parasphingopyxis algicola]